MKVGQLADSRPLQEMFLNLVDRHFDEDIGLRDPDVKEYIAAMLSEFADAENLFRVKNAEGKPIQDVGEMLLESDPIYGPAPSFDRERQVRKHIGDYTLFFSGMFPESINHFRLRKQRLENLIDFMKAGKESYYIVSKFEHFEYAKVAPLFAKLSKEFENCVYGLNCVKTELDEMHHPIIGKTRDFIM